MIRAAAFPKKESQKGFDVMKKRERGGRRAMKQNLFRAFGDNIIGIGLALYGLLTPIYAAFASLFVTINASRIGRSRWASE